jgi:hypothetical protein
MMVRSLIAAVAALVVCSSGTLSAENLGTIYSNMRQETKFGTYDCAGYTVRIIENVEGQTEVYFTAHQGNCSIEGDKAEEVSYYPKRGVLSFPAPFYASVGRGINRAYYRFKGTIFKDRLEGQLKIEYPSHPKYNKENGVRHK